MAENEREVREDQANGNDTDDLASLKARLADTEKKLGTLVNERKKIADDRNKLTERLKVWNDLAEEHGIEPEQLKALLASKEENELQNARSQGDLDKLIANATKAANKVAEEEKTKREKAESIVQRVLVDDVLNRLLDKYVEPKYKRAVFAFHRGKMETIEDSEDDYGMRTVVRVGNDYMSADEYLKHWAETDEEAAPFLKESMASGGGAQPGSAGGRLRFKARLEMTPAEKSQYIRQNGLDAYNKLPLKKTP